MSRNCTVRLSLIILVALFIAPLALGSTKAAEPGESVWVGLWNSCQSYKRPSFIAKFASFRKLIGQGRSWSSRVNRTRNEIDHVTNHTCRTWALNPNGHQSLLEFRKEFSAIASSALGQKEENRTELSPALDQRWNAQSAELNPNGFSFDDFPCGKAVRTAQAHIEEQLNQLESGFDRLRKECPKAADGALKELAEASAHMAKNAKRGEGAPSANKQPRPRHGSDITGLEKPPQQIQEGEKK